MAIVPILSTQLLSELMSVNDTECYSRMLLLVPDPQGLQKYPWYIGNKNLLHGWRLNHKPTAMQARSILKGQSLYVNPKDSACLMGIFITISQFIQKISPVVSVLFRLYIPLWFTVAGSPCAQTGEIEEDIFHPLIYHSRTTPFWRCRFTLLEEKFCLSSAIGVLIASSLSRLWNVSYYQTIALHSVF